MVHGEALEDVRYEKAEEGIAKVSTILLVPFPVSSTLKCPCSDVHFLSTAAILERDLEEGEC